MVEGGKKGWRRLRDGKPGDRFQGYQRAHAAERHGKWTLVVSLAGGTLLIAVGLVAVPAPGPGWLIVALGAGLIARESPPVARGLDWIELQLRKVLGAAKRLWTAASTPIKVLIGLTGTALAAGVGAAACSFIIAG